MTSGAGLPEGGGVGTEAPPPPLHLGRTGGANVDAAMKELLQYGMAGILMSVIVAMAWFLLSATLKARESDLKWHRENDLSKRQEFLVALAKQQEVFSQVMHRGEQAVTAALARVVDKLERIEERSYSRRHGDCPPPGDQVC